MTVAVEDLLSRCVANRNHQGLFVDCPSIYVANRLWEERDRWVDIARILNVGSNGIGSKIFLTIKGQDFASPFNPFADQSQTSVATSAATKRDRNHMSELLRLGAYGETLDFVRDANEPVCITNHLTNTCLLMNNSFSRDRLTWMPVQYIGMNFLWLWRDSMDDYDRLQQELRQNGYATNFSYKMRRVDGSMAEYTKDFYLIDNFLGATARLSISKQWRSLKDQ